MAMPQGKSSRAYRADAIKLLKADHRQVEGWFAQFEKSKNGTKKEQLATMICDALTVDLESLGKQLAARKKELMAEAKAA